MGTITRSFVNGLTTNGVLGASNINNASLNNITSISGPEMTLISSATASSSASIEFSLGNYKEYKFFFVNIHPSVNYAYFQFNGSTDSGSNYNVTKTTTFFETEHAESDAGTNLSYRTDLDLAQSTAVQKFNLGLGNNNDDNLNGELTLFNPSSTTYVKHFMYCGNESYPDYTTQCFVAGYMNTTSAVNAIRFQMNSGNIDAGKILMFGVN